MQSKFTSSIVSFVVFHFLLLRKLNQNALLTTITIKNIAQGGSIVKDICLKNILL